MNNYQWSDPAHLALLRFFALVAPASLPFRAQVAIIAADKQSEAEDKSLNNRETILKFFSPSLGNTRARASHQGSIDD